MSRARSLVALAFLILLSAPTAQAGWFFWAQDEPFAIAVPPLRAGDRLLYEAEGARQGISVSSSSSSITTITGGTQTTSSEDVEVTPAEPWTSTRVVEVADASFAVDKYGIERATDKFRIDTTRGEHVSAVECHRLQGGAAAVRRDALLGGEYSWGSGSGMHVVGPIAASQEEQKEGTLVATFWDRPCLHETIPGDYIEGMRLRLGDLVPTIDAAREELLSSPARATEFHGRRALEFTFDESGVRDGDVEAAPGSLIRITLADGLPGPVVWAAEGGWIWHGATANATSTETLAAFEAGSGAPVSSFDGEELPSMNPLGSPRSYDPLRLDDSALRLAFPYADAYAALLADPQAGFAAWLDANPEARLVLAGYDRGEHDSTLWTSGADRYAESDGGWSLWFSSEQETYSASVVRYAAARTPAGTVPLAHKPVLVQGSPGGGSFPGPTAAAFDVPDPAALAAAATLAGVDVGTITSLDYSAFAWGDLELSVRVSDAPLDEERPTTGEMAEIDLRTGGLRETFTVVAQRDSSSFVPAAGPSTGVGLDDERTTSALALLAGPTPGAGLAGGAAAAATGLALLVVALKFGLVPFYSRLVRDRILDNPVRARLFDRIRREPGIRLRELIEFTGAGDGATRRHLDALVKHRFVVEVRETALVGYYAAGDVPPALARRAALLRSGSRRRVYDLYAAEPAVSLRDAGERLGLSAPTVLSHKRKLEKAGLLPAAPMAEATLVEA